MSLLKLMFGQIGPLSNLLPQKIKFLVSIFERVSLWCCSLCVCWWLRFPIPSKTIHTVVIFSDSHMKIVIPPPKIANLLFKDPTFESWSRTRVQCAAFLFYSWLMKRAGDIFHRHWTGCRFTSLLTLIFVFQHSLVAWCASGLYRTASEIFDATQSKSLSKTTGQSLVHFSNVWRTQLRDSD